MEAIVAWGVSALAGTLVAPSAAAIGAGAAAAGAAAAGYSALKGTATPKLPAPVSVTDPKIQQAAEEAARAEAANLRKRRGALSALGSTMDLGKAPTFSTKLGGG